MLGSGADEDERLIGRDVDPTMEGLAIGLPDDWQLRGPIKAKPSAVNGAVRTTRKAQLAAQRPRRNPVQDDAGTPRAKNAKNAKAT